MDCRPGKYKRKDNLIPNSMSCWKGCPYFEVCREERKEENKLSKHPQAILSREWRQLTKFLKKATN